MAVECTVFREPNNGKAMVTARGLVTNWDRRPAIGFLNPTNMQDRVKFESGGSEIGT